MKKKSAALCLLVSICICGGILCAEEGAIPQEQRRPPAGEPMLDHTVYLTFDLIPRDEAEPTAILAHTGGPFEYSVRWKADDGGAFQFHITGRLKVRDDADKSMALDYSAEIHWVGEDGEESHRLVRGGLALVMEDRILVAKLGDQSLTVFASRKSPEMPRIMEREVREEPDERDRKEKKEIF